AGAACLLVGDASWLLLTGPPGMPLLAVWFLAAAAFGAFLPGWANQVSMVRAHLAGPGLIYALSPRSFGLLAVTVALAGLTDLLDGAVARRFEGVSSLGGALDPVVDGVFFGAVAIGLAAGGAYPHWLAAVVVLRYLLPALAGGVLLLWGRRPRLSHTPLGQGSTMLIAILLGGAGLLRALGQDTGTLLTFSEVLIPVGALATFGNLLWANRHSIGGSGAPRGG
ncbi:MAG: CDP-alcohol phosphatidyltransferase family protein, partial [Candidatus Dormibacteraeota bacterium]|nr:CDP-alcohol phosphatidyltransferase family protein [Candidatus Dormibacteraeota bacterium]